MRRAVSAERRGGAVALWWVRRDLRLTDNQALAEALRHADQVVPVFVIDTALLRSRYVGPKRLAFLWGGLRSLDASLRACGSRLVVRQGDPRTELARLMVESGAHVIFAEEDVSPYARRRDARVARALPLRLVPGLTVHPPDVVRAAEGGPLTVFTRFLKAWQALPLPPMHAALPAPQQIATPSDLLSLPIPAEPRLPSASPFPPGEAEAQRRLRDFVDRPAAPIYRYGDARDRLDVMGTSALSPYLRFGMISARQAVLAAWRAREAAPDVAARQSAEAWLRELVWREFYISLLYHFPHVRRRAFREDLRAVPWRNDEADFTAWCTGRTGYPVVDAAMRQLLETGWMHNRARMIVASFLVKDLLVDWRWGERWFMQHLLDGDPAANNGGWQWVAGVGTDAAPYFRVFNPVLQGKRFDPEGRFVRSWLPELARVPSPLIHEPWLLSPEEQRDSACLLGRDYPFPIVDHAWARGRALAAYRGARQGEIMM